MWRDRTEWQEKNIAADLRNTKQVKACYRRLGVKQYKYDWSRNECFIEFTYKNQYYRFEHSLHKAAEHKQNIHYSSDLFAQLVKTLEILPEWLSVVYMICLLG